jgi:hypothetical protein
VTVATRTAPAVHLLMVHGVGTHARLANVLRTYQTLRANLTSAEAPTTAEDRIPGWRLAAFDEAAALPFLELASPLDPQTGRAKPTTQAEHVYLYEVNYATFAGVVRRNHKLDLTSLLLGLDLAIVMARGRARAVTASVLGGDTATLGRILQRVAQTLAACTAPIIGVPSLLFRRYLGTFVGVYTRFLEDVATYVVDKSGEDLIEAHFDQTVTQIAGNMLGGDRLVIAAHSLGSVVTHNFLVRNWRSSEHRLPDRVVTFGSPIGLLVWVWLLLDFYDMNFSRPVAPGDRYFSWTPVPSPGSHQREIAWTNAVNLGDPLATLFPLAAVDLGAGGAVAAAGLVGGAIQHRFFGRAAVASVAGAHTAYLDDKAGFVELLLRAAELAPGTPDDVTDARDADGHWRDTCDIVTRTQRVMSLGVVLFIIAYIVLIVRITGDWRAIWFVPAFAWPAATIGGLALFQRLMFGGPTKRVLPDDILELKPTDVAGAAYRFREQLRKLFGRSRKLDPMAPGPGHEFRTFARRTSGSIASFIPTAIAMTAPVLLIPVILGEALPSPRWQFGASVDLALGLALFMGYVMCCAGHELLRCWLDVMAVYSDGASKLP